MKALIIILALSLILPEPLTPRYEATEEERELLAREIMREGSVLPDDGKQAIGQTIINRVLSDKFPNTIEEVITQKTLKNGKWVYQFSQTDNGDPTPECYEAADAALMYEGFRPDMFYFRTDHYHTFGKPYFKIKNTYFSTEDWND